MTITAKDVNGNEVTVGAKVKLVSIPEWLLSSLPDEEARDLKTMLGETFEVYEIDEWGSPCIEKWFRKNEQAPNCHSLSLEAHEMELVK